MIKVLQIIDGSSFGGISKLMLDVSNNIGKDIKFDFLSATKIYNDWYNLDANRKSIKGKMLYNYRLFKFLKKHEYDVIHINSAVFLFSFQVVLIAKLVGIKKIIVHSHNSPYISKTRKIIIKLLNPIYRKMTDCHLTCSKEASKSLFTKTDDVVLIKNGVNISKFRYNESIRNKYRKELNVDDKVVYGHVGRIHKQKNHDFLIDLFYEIQKKNPNVSLMVVGTGEDEYKVRSKVKELSIDDKVLFLGFREDTNKLLFAMDVFLFPSVHEGLPVSIIEAQTSGLPVVVSNAITEDSHILDCFYKIDSFDLKKWIKKVETIKINNNRKDAYKKVIDRGYDIKDTAKQLEKIYKGLIR